MSLPKPPPALEVEAVTKAYGEQVALDAVGLAVRPGEAVALVGRNGSGKSTLLRIAAGLLEATGGEVRVDGAVAGSEGARRATSYVPDDPVLYDDLSLWEHIWYVARLHDPAGRDQLGVDLADRLGLHERLDDLPSRFSRGLRQKAALVVALARPYRVLLVDEPFVGLDAPGRAALLELLDEARDAGATTVVATHEPSFVERVDRCVALRDGELVHDGPATPADVLRLVS